MTILGAIIEMKKRISDLEQQINEMKNNKQSLSTENDKIEMDPFPDNDNGD